MLDLRIEWMDDDGSGVGRSGGLAVHVPGTLPGELVRARIEHRSPHRPDAWARLVEVVEPSPARRAPPCPSFGVCGGCPLLHAEYDEQLRIKEARLERTLRRHLSLRDVPVETCLPSPTELRYRDQAKYVVATIGGRMTLASYAPRTHRPVDMKGCMVPEEPVQRAAEALVTGAAARGLRSYDERRREGLLRYVVARANARGNVVVVLVAARDFPEAGALANDLCQRCPWVTGVVLDVNTGTGGAIFGGSGRTLAGQDTLVEEVGGVRLVLGARSFFQVNRAQAARLYGTCAELAAVQPGELALDLFSGVGGIAITLAQRGAKVIAVESNGEAITAARAAAAALGLEERCDFRCGDAAEVLSGIERADVIVLDPPRKGCPANLLARAALLGPRRIVYVSCEPRTLARDLDILASHGYRTLTVRPLDLFPATAHVESVAVLDRPIP